MIYEETRVVIKKYLERVKIHDSQTEDARLTSSVTDPADGCRCNRPFEEEDGDG